MKPLSIREPPSPRRGVYRGPFRQLCMSLYVTEKRTDGRAGWAKPLFGRLRRPHTTIFVRRYYFVQLCCNKHLLKYYPITLGNWFTYLHIHEI